jgi:hypothetical protein
LAALPLLTLLALAGPRLLLAGALAALGLALPCWRRCSF